MNISFYHAEYEIPTPKTRDVRSPAENVPTFLTFSLIRCITSKNPPLVAAAVVTRGGFLHVKKQGRGFLHVKTLKIIACGAIILPIYMFSGIYSSLNDLLVNILVIQVHY